MITIQGSRTGITGGAVPLDGHIINLSKMNKITTVKQTDRGTYVVLQPGVLLSELRNFITCRDKDKISSVEGAEILYNGTQLFFPPDPTETSASIGGMVSCNASGAISFFYGATRSYVNRLRVITSDGEIIELNRNGCRAKGRSFKIRTLSNKTLSGNLPSYIMPNTKNAAGYYAADDMEMIDLFIGSEGTLGIISEIEIKLIPKPAQICGVVIFFPSEKSALFFVEFIRKQAKKPVAIEFFDYNVLELLRRRKQMYADSFDIPLIPENVNAAVYVEFHAMQGEDIDKTLEEMCLIVNESGGSEELTWIALCEKEMEKLKTFRHAAPETVNMIIDERRKKDVRIKKLGTDLSVPDDYLNEVMSLYHETLQKNKLQYVIFGHIGNNHLHVNILPASFEEYQLGRDIYLQWAEKIVKMGGSISAEHGVGKLKKSLLMCMYGEKGINEMKSVKKVFDPSWILNADNLFD